MGKNNYVNAFQRNVFMKRLGTLVILIAIWPITYEKFFFGVVIMIVGLILLSQYKCPFCGTRFDIRLPAYRMHFCNECGVELKK